jgi:hypothetical protein
MNDDFAGHAAGLTAPANDGFAITPNDDADLTSVTRALYVGAGGDVGVVLVSGASVLLRNVGDGAVLPLRARRVLETTTAEDIVGLC